MNSSKHGICAAMRQVPSWKLLSLAALALLVLCTLSSTAAAETIAICEITASNGARDSEFAEDGGFPVDILERVWERPPDAEPGAPWGAWCYSNEEGRVRGRVITGSDAESPIDAKVILLWVKWFVRTPGTPDPEFTVNPSHLLLEAFEHDVSEQDAAKAFAEMNFRVQVVTADLTFTVFDHHSRMQGQPETHTFEFEQRTNGGAQRVLASGKTVHPATAGLDAVKNESLATFNVPSYTQAIGLDRYNVEIGERYAVVYILDVSAGELVYLESRAEAFLGDPLDEGTGFSLSTQHEAAAAPAASCPAIEPGRFVHHGDGTATDVRTGLMWRRCPAGVDLDDAGTADATDDQCVDDAGADQQFVWQGALQAAANESLGGHDDWRAPNAKELESLVAACPGPALTDPLTFPGLPASSFWSATPEPGGSASPRRAWQVGFGNGELSPASRVAPAHVLAVRDTGDGPTPAGVSLAAGNASIAEGDSGTAVLAMPVALSAPLASDVTVDYVLTGMDATDGADFTAAAGMLTIPAGDTIALVDVQVIGDTDVEQNELVRLELDNAAGVAWVRSRVGIGTIVDDEPVFQPAAAQVSEGDANATVNIVVQLDRPAVEAVSIDFATADDTANAGADYLAAAGTVVIQPGDTEGTLPLTVVGDLAPESTERLEITFDNAVGVSLIPSPAVMIVTIVDDDGPGSYGALNDTGVTECATGSQTSLACPQAGYPGQDAEYGRDVTDGDPADGALGFSFLKRDADGDPLADQSALYSQTAWDCVEDQVTGLVWEVKTDQPADVRFSDHTFSWYNSSGSNDGGDPGTANGGICSDGANCDTEKYVATVNAAGLCGFNDWRLPSADELFTIAWLSAGSFTGIDTSYFANHFAPPDGRGYWSATPSAASPQSSAVRVRLDAGLASASISSAAKSNTHRVRLVRGGSRL